jgi:hypothetical protein
MLNRGRDMRSVSFFIILMVLKGVAQNNANAPVQAPPCPGLSAGTKTLLFSVSINAALLSATQHQQTYGGDVELMKTGI